jgi:hypothetical protein
MTTDHTAGPGTRGSGTTIEAIPTAYRGTTFRSRLEANWAASLDARGIVWEYEPKGIDLPSGRTYIPDFWLPSLGTWIEVKGPGVPGVEKAIELGETRTCRCTDRCTCQWPGGELVLIGHPPLKYDAWTHHEDDQLPLEVVFHRERRHPGFLNWSTAHGRATYFAECRTCLAAGWFELRAPVGCRACRRPLVGSHAYRAQDKELEFLSAPTLSLPIFARPDLATTAFHQTGEA